jgi:hypothetical protein
LPSGSPITSTLGFRSTNSYVHRSTPVRGKLFEYRDPRLEEEPERPGATSADVRALISTPSRTTIVSVSGRNASGTLRARGIGPTNSPSWLIDCEEDRTLRAVLVGMLREHQR